MDTVVALPIAETFKEMQQAHLVPAGTTYSGAAEDAPVEKLEAGSFFWACVTGICLEDYQTLPSQQFYQTFLKARYVWLCWCEQVASRIGSAEVLEPANTAKISHAHMLEVPHIPRYVAFHRRICWICLRERKERVTAE